MTPSTADGPAAEPPKKVTFPPAAQELGPIAESSAISSPADAGAQKTGQPEPSPEVAAQPDIVDSVRDQDEEQRARDFRRRKITERCCHRWRRIADRRATIRHALESRSRLREFINESRERQKQEQHEETKKRKSGLITKAMVDDMVEAAERKKRRVFEASVLSASQPELGRHRRSRTEYDADAAMRAAPASTSGPGSSGSQERRRRSYRGPVFLSGGSIIDATKSTSAYAAVSKYGIHDTTKSDLWRLKAAGLELLPNGSVQPFGMPPPSPRTSSKRSFDETNGQEGGSESGSGDDSLRPPKRKPPPWILSTFAPAPIYSHASEMEAAQAAQAALVRERGGQSKRAPETNGTGAAGPASAAQDVIALDDSSEDGGAAPKPAAATRVHSSPRHEPERARKRANATTAKDQEDLFARVRRVNEAMEEGIAFYRSEIDKQKERWKQALLGRKSQGATPSKGQAPTNSMSATSKRPSMTPNVTLAKGGSRSRNGINNWMDAGSGSGSGSRSWYRYRS